MERGAGLGLKAVLPHGHPLGSRKSLSPLNPSLHLYGQCGRTTRTMAHCTCSQFLHSSASNATVAHVSATWRRLRSSGAANLAAVDTQTRMTVTMASMMLMHLPSSTLASVCSSCTVCCCCCCCSSSLETRVWHDSSTSCVQHTYKHTHTHTKERRVSDESLGGDQTDSYCISREQELVITLEWNWS